MLPPFLPERRHRSDGSGIAYLASVGLWASIVGGESDLGAQPLVQPVPLNTCWCAAFPKHGKEKRRVRQMWTSRLNLDTCLMKNMVPAYLRDLYVQLSNRNQQNGTGFDKS